MTVPARSFWQTAPAPAGDVARLDLGRTFVRAAILPAVSLLLPGAAWTLVT